MSADARRQARPPQARTRARADRRAQAQAQAQARVLARDRAFLPAALEILEMPPSPVRMGLLVLICAFTAVALTWSYLSRIDIIAVAQGKLQPTGRVKFIQPLETSRVVAARVENGEAVEAGAVLVELDPAEAAADLAATAADLASFRAEAIRRQAAITAAQNRNLAPRFAGGWPQATRDANRDAIPLAIQRREERVYAADLGQLAAQVDGLGAQRAQKEAERQRLIATVAAEEELVATLAQRVAMKVTLMEHNAGSRADLLDATESLQEQKITLAQQKGQLAEADASLVVLGKDIRRAYETFTAENAQKLAEAERQIGELSEKEGKARARLDHMTLRSPISGTVQASALTTVGQVVTSGQELMRVVPERAALEIECYLPNRDIGFVKAGDRAVIKVESFPFTRYGTIEAEVVRVARDAIPEPDAAEIEKGGARTPAALSAAGGQRTQNLVFPVTLKPRRATIGVDGLDVPLSAGMAVTAEIRTGDRRILEYVFAPLVKVAAEAMKER